MGDLHLRGVAVFEHGFAVVDINALDKSKHGGLLLLGEVIKIERILLRGDRLNDLFFFLGRRGLHGGSAGGRRLGSRNRLGLLVRQHQVGDRVVFHINRSFVVRLKQNYCTSDDTPICRGCKAFLWRRGVVQ